MTRRRAWLRARIPALRRWHPAAAAAAGAPIRPGERVLISVPQPSAALVIATERAIYHHDGAGTSCAWSRLAWDDIDQVLWDGEQQVLTLTRAGGGESSPMVLLLPRSGTLVELARERVTATTVARAPLLSAGRVCGWLTARRAPGSDTVRWVLALRDTTAASDPALPSCVARAITALEADLGLTSWRPPSTHEGWWPES